MKSILDPTFRYVPACKTNLAATFARIRREQAKVKATLMPAANVATIRRKA